MNMSLFWDAWSEQRKEWMEAPALKGRMRSFPETQVQARGGFCGELSGREHEHCSQLSTLTWTAIHLGFS